MLEEDNINLRLFCHSCDNVNCVFSKKLEYINEDFKQGCMRSVSIEDFERYTHYLQEVIPFWKIIKNTDLIDEQYHEIISFLEEHIYASEIKNLFNKKGKVVSFKDMLTNIID